MHVTRGVIAALPSFQKDNSFKIKFEESEKNQGNNHPVQLGPLQI